MSRALATSQRPAPDAAADAAAKAKPAAAAAAARSEARLIALLTGGAIVAGAIAQIWVPPGPVALGVTALLVGVGLTVVSLAWVKGRLLNALAGFRMATVVLIALALASALGTLLLQNKPVEFYQTRYGAFGGVVLGLRLDDIFHTVWFGALVGLMITGLVVSAVRRLPITARNVGFHAVHLGILVTLAGASLSSVFAVRGRIDLKVGGAAANVVNLTRNNQPTGEVVPLGASVALEDFDVDHYREQQRLSVYLPDAKSGNYALKASFEPVVGLKSRLPEGGSFRVLGYYPDLVINEKVQPAAAGTGAGVPALAVTLDGREQWLLLGERNRIQSQDGKTAIVVGAERPSLAALTASPHRLSVAAAGAEGAAGQPVRLGETVDLGGAKVKAVAFYPHFTYDIQNRRAATVDDEPVNPALEVEVNGERRFLFSKMAGHGAAGSGPELASTYAPDGGLPADTVAAVGLNDKTVQIRAADGSEQTLPLTEGLAVGAAAKLGRFIPNARVEREPTTASNEPRKPAALVEVKLKDTEAFQKLLVSGTQDFAQASSDGVLTLEARGDEVKSFRSQVAVSGLGPEVTRAIVAVNDPMPVGPWKLYQVNYDPKDPTYSGLEAVRDPGVTWVFAGFVLMFVGVVYIIYVQPRLKRREA